MVYCTMAHAVQRRTKLQTKLYKEICMTKYCCLVMAFVEHELIITISAIPFLPMEHLWFRTMRRTTCSMESSFLGNQICKPLLGFSTALLSLSLYTITARTRRFMLPPQRDTRQATPFIRMLFFFGAFFFPFGTKSPC